MAEDNFQKTVTAITGNGQKAQNAFLTVYLLNIRQGHPDRVAAVQYQEKSTSEGIKEAAIKDDVANQFRKALDDSPALKNEFESLINRGRLSRNNNSYPLLNEFAQGHKIPNYLVPVTFNADVTPVMRQEVQAQMQQFAKDTYGVITPFEVPSTASLIQISQGLGSESHPSGRMVLARSEDFTHEITHLLVSAEHGHKYDSAIGGARSELPHQVNDLSNSTSTMAYPQTQSAAPMPFENARGRKDLGAADLFNYQKYFQSPHWGDPSRGPQPSGALFMHASSDEGVRYVQQNQGHSALPLSPTAQHPVVGLSSTDPNQQKLCRFDAVQGEVVAHVLLDGGSPRDMLGAGLLSPNANDAVLKIAPLPNGTLQQIETSPCKDNYVEVHEGEVLRLNLDKNTHAKVVINGGTLDLRGIKGNIDLVVNKGHSVLIGSPEDLSHVKISGGEQLVSGMTLNWSSEVSLEIKDPAQAHAQQAALKAVESIRGAGVSTAPPAAVTPPAFSAPPSEPMLDRARKSVKAPSGEEVYCDALLDKDFLKNSGELFGFTNKNITPYKKQCDAPSR